MNVENGHTKTRNNETKKKKKKNYNVVNFLHVNGHTVVRPGMACVPLGNHW